MSKYIAIILYVVCWTEISGQITKPHSTKKLENEICISIEAIPGKIIKNQSLGFADTTLAQLSGKILEGEEISLSACISLMDRLGRHKFIFSDIDGNFNIYLDSGEYKMEVSNIGCNKFIIEKIQLKPGQRQEIYIDLGRASGFVTYSIKSKKKHSKRK